MNLLIDQVIEDLIVLRFAASYGNWCSDSVLAEAKIGLNIPLNGIQISWTCNTT